MNGMASNAEAPAAVRLTYKHASDVRRMMPVEGEDPQDVMECRLAMIANREPAIEIMAPASVKKRLAMPLADYRRYVAPALEQGSEMPEATGNADGSWNVGDYTLRPLVGKDMRLAAAAMRGGQDAEARLLMSLTGLSESELEALPIGVTNAMAGVAGFLIGGAWTGTAATG